MERLYLASVAWDGENGEVFSGVTIWNDRSKACAWVGTFTSRLHCEWVKAQVQLIDINSGYITEVAG